MRGVLAKAIAVSAALLLVLAACSSSDSTASSEQTDDDVSVLVGHTEPIIDMIVLEDGRLLSIDDAGDLRVWALASGEAEIVVEAGLTKLSGLDLLEDGRVITGTSRGAQIWDLSDLDSEPLVIPESVNTNAVAVLADNTIAIGGVEGFITLWDAADLTTPTLTYGEHTSAGEFGAQVDAIVELSDGTIASAVAGEVHRWDRTSPAAVISSTQGLQVGLFSIAELPAGGYVSRSTNGRVVVWDFDQLDSYESGYPTESFYTGSTVIVLDDGHIASRGQDVRIWSVDDPLIALAAYERDQATALVQLRDGRFAVGYFDGQIHLWDPGLE